MASPKEFKSAASAGRPQNIESPIPSESNDSQGYMSGLISKPADTSDYTAGLVENPYEQKQHPGAITQQDLVSMSEPIGKAALPVAAGAGLAAAPAWLAVTGVAGASALGSVIYDKLKNYSATSEDQKISNPTIIGNAIIDGALGGASEAASRTVLSWMINRAIKADNQNIKNLASNYAIKKYGPDALKDMGLAESLGLKEGQHIITLTPSEAFPFDPQAVAFADEMLKRYPQLGTLQAKKLGAIQTQLQSLSSVISQGKDISNLSELASLTQKNLQIRINNIQGRLNELGSSIDATSDGKSILDKMKSEIINYGGSFEGDSLTGTHEGLSRVSAEFNRLQNSLKIPKSGEADRIISMPSGSREFSETELTSEATNKFKNLSVSDIDRVRRNISDIANWEKDPRVGLSPDEKLARKLYPDIVEIRDNLNSKIADASGDPVLSSEVREYRNDYKQKVEGLNLIQDNLKQQPTDQIKYLFSKNSPQDAKAIMAALDQDQKLAIKGEFVKRLVDPIFLKHSGEINPTPSFVKAYNEWLSYDPKVLEAVYSSKEISDISQWLNLGRRVEESTSAIKAAEEGTGLAKKFGDTTIALLYKTPGLKKVVQAVSGLIEPQSSLRQYLDARLYMQGVLNAEDMAPGALKLIDKLVKVEPTTLRATPTTLADIGVRAALAPTVRHLPSAIGTGSQVLSKAIGKLQEEIGQ